MALRRQLLSLRHQLSATGEAFTSTSSSSSRQTKFPSAAAFLFSTAPSQAVAASNTASRRSSSKQNITVLERLRSLLRDYKQLSKFRLGALVTSTAAAGYASASEERIDWGGMGWTCAGTMLAAASANALNQVYEIVNDGRMKRTANRPLPGGRMSRLHALAFAALAGVGGVWLLAEKTNNTAAALGAANIFLYAAVYTPLKQISVVNTWIGAVVGAVPPLMGWAAASGGLDVGAIILASGVYFWQLPHFMALAWMCRADYLAGGYRMLSLIDPTGKRTAACALRNCFYLLPLGALATWLGVTTPYFAYESAFITGGMLLTAAKFYSSPSQSNARLLFRASLLHLPVFMIAFLLHRRPNTGEDRLKLFAHNANLLGLGSGAAATLLREEEDARARVLVHQQQQRRNQGQFVTNMPLPALPFLPVPHLSMNCPSKAMCMDDGGEEAVETQKKENSSDVSSEGALEQQQQPLKTKKL